MSSTVARDTSQLKDNISLVIGTRKKLALSQEKKKAACAQALEDIVSRKEDAEKLTHLRIDSLVRAHEEFDANEENRTHYLSPLEQLLLSSHLDLPTSSAKSEVKFATLSRKEKMMLEYASLLSEENERLKKIENLTREIATYQENGAKAKAEFSALQTEFEEVKQLAELQESQSLEEIQALEQVLNQANYSLATRSEADATAILNELERLAKEIPEETLAACNNAMIRDKEFIVEKLNEYSNVLHAQTKTAARELSKKSSALKAEVFDPLLRMLKDQATASEDQVATLHSLRELLLMAYHDLLYGNVPVNMDNLGHELQKHDITERARRIGMALPTTTPLLTSSPDSSTATAANDTDSLHAEALRHSLLPQALLDHLQGSTAGFSRKGHQDDNSSDRKANDQDSNQDSNQDRRQEDQDKAELTQRLQELVAQIMQTWTFFETETNTSTAPCTTPSGTTQAPGTSGSPRTLPVPPSTYFLTAILQSFLLLSHPVFEPVLNSAALAPETARTAPKALSAENKEKEVHQTMGGPTAALKVTDLAQHLWSKYLSKD